MFWVHIQLVKLFLFLYGEKNKKNRRVCVKCDKYNNKKLKNDETVILQAWYQKLFVCHFVRFPYN